MAKILLQQTISLAERIGRQMVTLINSVVYTQNNN